jgi:hypothetical protein
LPVAKGASSQMSLHYEREEAGLLAFFFVDALCSIGISREPPIPRRNSPNGFGQFCPSRIDLIVSYRLD